MKVNALGSFLIDVFDCDDGVPIDQIDDALTALVTWFPEIKPIYDALDHSEGSLYLDDEVAADLRELFPL